VITLGVTATLLVALAIFLRTTATGTQMRAAAEDFDAARLCAVDANRVVAAAFALSGLLAGAISNRGATYAAAAAAVVIAVTSSFDAPAFLLLAILTGILTGWKFAGPSAVRA
jgi:branched-chain amino acid transport system permease protein